MMKTKVGDGVVGWLVAAFEGQWTLLILTDAECECGRGCA